VIATLHKNRNMPNSYIGYHFNIEPRELGSEMIAELGETALKALQKLKQESPPSYKDLWDEMILENIQILQSEEFTIEYTFAEIEQVNWNEEWEKNFEPIDVDEYHVRAPFLQTEAEYILSLSQKMSFGTGHHETTHMMIQHLLETDVTG
jgi:ribosomal protein L11 methyltransferase